MTSLHDWLERFTRTCDAIAAHPDVHVINRHVEPGATDEEIARVEAEIDTKLDPSIVSLYRQANGLSFQWISKRRLDQLRAHGSDPVQLDRELTKKGLLTYPGDNGWHSGSICLLPLAQVYLVAERDWDGIFVHDFLREDTTEFRGVERNAYDLALATRVFDYFHFFSMAAFCTIDDRSNPPIVIGDDHGASFEESEEPLFFEAYMERRLASYFARGNGSLDEIVDAVD